MMGYYDGNWGVGEWIAMSVMMVAFWGLLVALVMWAVRSTRGGRDTLSRPDEVLAERYARGEIDSDEFQRSREVLHPASGPRT